jgi:hypothetical protein
MALIGISVLSYLLLIINAMRFAKKCECTGECQCGEEKQIVRVNSFAKINQAQYESAHH